jgi:hypothetical protein
MKKGGRQPSCNYHCIDNIYGRWLSVELIVPLYHPVSLVLVVQFIVIS